MFNDQAGGVAFQHTAQFHQLGDFAAGHGRNIGSALRDQFHQPVGDQQQQRLPDRGAGDPDFGGQLLLVEELPLHLRVDQDVLAQVAYAFSRPDAAVPELFRIHQVYNRVE